MSLSLNYGNETLTQLTKYDTWKGSWERGLYDMISGQWEYEYV